MEDWSDLLSMELEMTGDNSWLSVSDWDRCIAWFEAASNALTITLLAWR